MLLLSLIACDGAPAEPDVPACAAASGDVCTWAGTGDAGFNGEGLDRLESFFYWPADIEFSPYGLPVIQDWNNHKIRAVQDDGTVTTIMGSAFVGDGPYDLSDLEEPGAAGETVNLNHPTDAVYFPDGRLLSASWHTHKLRTWDPETGLVLVTEGGAPGFVGENGESIVGMKMNMPKAVDIDPEGNIYIVDMRNQRVRMVTPALTVFTVAGDGTKGFADGAAAEANFSFPASTQPEPGGAIVYDAGRLYVADTENNRIRLVDLAAGTVSTIAGTGALGYAGDGGSALDAELNFPRDLELADGVLYVADTNNHAVRTIDLATGIIDTLIGTGEPAFSGDDGPAIDAALDTPYGVEVDDDGAVYVADTFNHRIRVVYP